MSIKLLLTNISNGIIYFDDRLADTIFLGVLMNLNDNTLPFIPRDVQELQIVVLENPYKVIENKIVQEFFAKTCALKVAGYRARFDYGVLPFSTTDLFGTNILICQKSEDGLKPICGYKSVPLSECKAFNLPFPPLTVAKDNKEICKLLDSILSDSESAGEDISFDSSWTILPELRGNRPLKTCLKEMIIALTMGHHRDYNIPRWITSGTVKMNTHLYFESMGLTPVSDNPIYQHASLFNSDCMMFYLQNYSPLAYAMFEKYAFLWNNRIELSEKSLAEANEFEKVLSVA